MGHIYRASIKDTQTELYNYYNRADKNDVRYYEDFETLEAAKAWARRFDDDYVIDLYEWFDDDVNPTEVTEMDSRTDRFDEAFSACEAALAAEEIDN